MNNFVTLYLLAYNNYYNRLVKKEESLNDYAEYIVATQENINFNPNDGINTQQVVNFLTESDINPDYLLVVSDGIIKSRWFIIEAERTRNGQYNLTLHRDVAVDYYDEIVDAPCFIEKATLDSSDPMIFNKEDMTYNQIKTEQTLLDEKLDDNIDGWLVGYVADDFLSTGEGGAAQDKTINYGITVKASSDKTKEELQAYIDKIYIAKSVKMEVVQRVNNKTPYTKITVGIDGEIKTETIYGAEYSYIAHDEEDYTPILIDSLRAKYRQQYSSLFVSEDISLYNGKTCIGENDNKLYQITVRQISYNSYNNSVQGVLGTDLTNQLQDEGVTNIDLTRFKVEIKGKIFKIDFTEVSSSQETITIRTSIRKLSDAPYYMFCMAYQKQKSDLQIQTIIGIAQALGSACYDIQILPYKPLFFEGEDSHIDVDYTNTSAGLLQWCYKSSFITDIPYKKEITDFKVESECDMYRICSPNGSGLFEFNAAKNGGIDGFIANCTYKPINPYINVVPRFKGLYGQNFQDYRGLICQGDFSLPRINDQWIEYQLQNKNFQASFNRQIESMELNNRVQKHKIL